MDNSYPALIKWVERSKCNFLEFAYSLDDIVNLAIAYGFDRSAIAQWQIEQRKLDTPKKMKRANLP